MILFIGTSVAVIITIAIGQYALSTCYVPGTVVSTGSGIHLLIFTKSPKTDTPVIPVLVQQIEFQVGSHV